MAFVKLSFRWEVDGNALEKILDRSHTTFCAISIPHPTESECYELSSFPYPYPTAWLVQTGIKQNLKELKFFMCSAFAILHSKCQSTPVKTETRNLDIVSISGVSAGDILRLVEQHYVHHV